jgi:hypothetical protein
MITLALSPTTLGSLASKSHHSPDVEKTAVTLHIPTAFSLSWSGLTYEVNGRTILSDVSGELRSGQMFAVMGPSGTFMQCYTINFD